MGIFFFIIIVIVFIGLFLLGGVLNLVMSVLRGIFSFGKPSQKNTNTRENQYRQTTKTSTRNKNERSYFDKNDAEDAEYEEIS